MSPRLVPCHCDPDFPAMAVCPECELGQLEDTMRRRGVITYDPPTTDSRSHLERFWTDGTVAK